MGAGRQRKEDAIDLAVGIDFVAEIGDEPGADGLVARVLANDEAAAEAAGRELLDALTLVGGAGRGAPAHPRGDRNPDLDRARRGYVSGMAEDDSPELQKSLKSRHMTMISLGGVIGAGLFVGSSAVINTTGPAAVLSYLAAGFLIVLVMRMLGEMAVANPQVGSFAEYARRSLGGWAGFSVGWLYWYFWSIVLAIEAVAGAEILQRWIDAPVWLMALLLMAPADRDQPRVGEVLRRVRVLVRRHQGRRDRGLHRDRRSASCSASAPATRPASRT